MTRQYQGKSGKCYDICEDQIANGGEGSIHAILGEDDLVAKIYKKNRISDDCEEKLCLMMRIKFPGNQPGQVAWPQDVIYDRNGFVGYIMPKVENASSLTETYSGTKYNLRSRLMVAYNLAASVDTVHQIGQVIGDFNPLNICVDLENNFRVTLVDTDSYHFTANGKTYRCVVGRGEYIAPELLNKIEGEVNLRNIPLPSFTKETDLFALAVNIFQLLMNGCHPFACVRDAHSVDAIGQMKRETDANFVGIPQPIDNIKEGFCVFFDTRAGMIPPSYAPKFETLPLSIRKLFIRTFKDGFREPKNRVTAKEWMDVLGEGGNQEFHIVNDITHSPRLHKHA